MMRVHFLVLLCCLAVTTAWNFNAGIRKMAAATAIATSLTMPSLALADAIPMLGNPAPAFSLPSNQAKSIGLDDLKGKRTVLYFYPGDFTSGCTIEAQGFEKNIKKFQDLGVQVVGVSVDSVEKHLDFSKFPFFHLYYTHFVSNTPSIILLLCLFLLWLWLLFALQASHTAWISLCSLTKVALSATNTDRYWI